MIAAVTLVLLVWIPSHPFPGSGMMECARTTVLDGGSQESLEPLRKTFRKWKASLRAGDLDAIAELVTDDAEFWSHGRPELTGKEALEKAFAPLFEKWTLDQSFRCEELILSGPLAVFRGTEVNRLTPLGGGDPVVQRQRAFSVLVKNDDGVWLFARGMTNGLPEE